jgi:hypothetical protein
VIPIDKSTQTFNPDTWICVGCGRIGTLCLEGTNATIRKRVETIDDKVYTGEVRVCTVRWGQYVCSRCGCVAADNDKQLLHTYPNKKRLIQYIRDASLDLHKNKYTEILDEFSLLSMSEKQLNELPLDRLQDMIYKIRNVLQDLV